jgi:F-type H+-transporting ATPase subunit epsilon
VFHMALDVLVLSPHATIFEGKAQSVILPGEQGVFEILPYHKPILSRLVSGMVIIDSQEFSIRRGVVQVVKNKVTVVIEEVERTLSGT